MRTKRRAVAAAATGLVLVTGLSGCSKKVESDKVGDQLKSALQKQSSSSKFGDPSCDDDLKAEVDATTKCSIEVDGRKRGYEAKVTKVDGSNVSFDFVPDN